MIFVKNELTYKIVYSIVTFLAGFEYYNDTANLIINVSTSACWGKFNYLCVSIPVVTIVTTWYSVYS